MRHDLEHATTVTGIGGDTSRAVDALVSRIEEVEVEAGIAAASAAMLQGAFHASAVGLVIVDQRGAVVASNPSADRVLEGGPDNAVVRGRLRDLMARVARSGEAEDLEFDLYTPERRVVGLSGFPLATEGDDPRGAMAYIEDHTERRRVDAMRRDFVTNAGHELRTPLGALMVLAETLADEEDPDVRKRLTVRLREEARRMASVVEDILALAAAESTETPHVPVHIDAVLAEAGQATEVLASETGVELQFIATPADLVVAGDHDQLVSAMANLLDNAVKYTVVGGRSSPVTYGAHASGDRVVIEVGDRGIGIEEGQVDRIFERFYRVDRGRSRESGGTGLGLSIVRNVVVAHGGDVTVRSELGVGSTFTVELPRLAA